MNQDQDGSKNLDLINEAGLGHLIDQTANSIVPVAEFDNGQSKACDSYDDASITYFEVTDENCCVTTTTKDISVAIELHLAKSDIAKQVIESREMRGLW